MKRSAANLTQQWWDEEKENLLCVNGFSMQGSDYEIFYKLCLCIEGLDDGGRAYYQGALDALYPELCIPLSSQNASSIWKETARLLFERGETYSRRPVPTERGAVSLCKIVGECAPIIRSVLPMNELSATDATTWHDWQGSTSRLMKTHLRTEVSISLTLPNEFRWQKPNLYAVNRHLSLQETNPDLWLSEQLYFLFSFAQKNGFRPLLSAECDVDRTIEALRGIRAFGVSVPIFYTSSKALSCEDLLKLCREIGWHGEGIKPLYLIRKAREEKVFLGIFGDISVIPQDP